MLSFRELLAEDIQDVVAFDSSSTGADGQDFTAFGATDAASELSGFAFKAEGSAPATLLGNVGIGTDSPGKELVVSKSGEVALALEDSRNKKFHYSIFQ